MDHQQPLIELAIIILILAAHSKGETWGVKVNRSITAVKGQSVTVPCTFSYPPMYHTENLGLFWKLFQRSAFKTYDLDTNAFIYHPNSTFVVTRYQGKTSLIARKNGRSCTLKIKNLMDSKLVIYFRIVAKKSFSFYNQSVMITTSGLDAMPGTFNPGIIFPTSAIPKDSQSLSNRNMLQTICIAVFVPLAAVVILLAAGLLLWKRHARSQSFGREGSGYYANFSRKSPNQATRKEMNNKHNDKKLPESKVIEEPVYINLQQATGQPDGRGGDHSIYENVDHALC
ncbi:sialoadhesin-like [Hippocampus zosterae]|uniref:sialoadhesin-like n=1 Tax=Hippocampus zosterae TaxID=109293 RepID=UPI00223D6CDD|nr:sialoadhesin-like [Hippocampus zosterae]